MIELKGPMNDQYKNIIKQHFKKDEVEIAFDLISHFDCTKLIIAIIKLAEGDLKWLRQYVKLAKGKRDEVLNAYEKRKIVKLAEKDIYISHTDKIKWIPFDPRLTKVKSMNESFEPLEDFFKSLELCCLAECCGIIAFSFHAKDVKNSAKNFNKTKLNQHLDLLINQLKGILEDIVSVNTLNQLFHKTVLIQLLIHIKASIND